jgi:hypothetical protein
MWLERLSVLVWSYHDTSEEEEDPENPNDNDFDPADEASSASFMVDEDEINQGGGNNVDIIDVINYTAPRRQWTQREFAIARDDNAYNQPHDTHNLYFHTTVQEQAFFSSLMECTVFAHQRVDFDYLESKPVLAGVATKLEKLSLKPFLQHICDWNDTITRLTSYSQHGSDTTLSHPDLRENLNARIHVRQDQVTHMHRLSEYQNTV